MLETEDFENFRQECINLQILYRTYADLYEGDDATDEVLRASAPYFFYDLNGWLIDLLLIKMSRLLDPARQVRTITSPSRL